MELDVLGMSYSRLAIPYPFLNTTTSFFITATATPGVLLWFHSAQSESILASIRGASLSSRPLLQATSVTIKVKAYRTTRIDDRSEGDNFETTSNGYRQTERHK